ncbi:hypothetical protein [Chryseobacterium indologenes]|uniref:Uncharacterized protein n=1 Tax=Chryseobacterium indologenes TaxID=253 RepID=A0A0N0IWB1_CHRID|nr:hypothetical protein [Chryseobacterium indologenes]KPE51241.1 hypothetical protein AOB46_11285 [Chryseobacterium indologenes]
MSLDLENQLVKYNERNLPNTFVSLAVTLGDSNIPEHAVILIRYRTVDYIFHFPGADPPLIENITSRVDPVLFYKILDNFDTEDDSDVGAFLRQCQRICNETDITYGFIFDASTYGEDGRYLSLSGLPEIASCVGFCVNVISKYVIDFSSTYFNLDDWDDSGIEGRIAFFDQWAQEEVIKKYPSVDWSLYNAFKKRITPLEYLCSGFCSVYPITKQTIENIKPYVEREIARKLA